MQWDIVTKHTNLIHYLILGACYKKCKIDRVQKHVAQHVKRKEAVSTTHVIILIWSFIWFLCGDFYVSVKHQRLFKRLNASIV